MRLHRLCDRWTRTSSRQWRAGRTSGGRTASAAVPRSGKSVRSQCRGVSASEPWFALLRKANRIFHSQDVTVLTAVVIAGPEPAIGNEGPVSANEERSDECAGGQRGALSDRRDGSSPSGARTASESVRRSRRPVRSQRRGVSASEPWFEFGWAHQENRVFAELFGIPGSSFFAPLLLPLHAEAPIRPW